MNQTANKNWALVAAILAGLASLATIGGYVSSKEVRCTVAKIINIESSDCKIGTGFINVNFIIQTAEREPVEGATVTFIFKGAPEQRISDGQGYVKNNIPLREDVDVIISKEGYETRTATLNLDPKRDDKPVIYQLKQKVKQQNPSTPLPSDEPSPVPQPTNPTSEAKSNADFKAIINTDKKSYVVGEQIKIKYSGMPALYNDFIILTDASTPDDNLNNSHSYFSVNKKDGDLKFDSLPSGNYEIRAYYNYRSGNYYKLIGRLTITIK